MKFCVECGQKISQRSYSTILNRKRIDFCCVPCLLDWEQKRRFKLFEEQEAAYKKAKQKVKIRVCDECSSFFVWPERTRFIISEELYFVFCSQECFDIFSKEEAELNSEI